ncbi:hypothetical protein IQ273_08345 [Nodosilinea sp. LEGE 07298]|uniref:hypothetical protein n=1 Tax=Nodosilinea sp. LEGE 07298 TaxID=2777970 RepID=UPI0018804B44|nr:hypothetical protein [Nodosilinea sp. LEGE 07298]MBE9109424.1 hypothetical protein [Nodosilinea sp. LEGE 07298]
MWTGRQERRIREQIRIQESLYSDLLEDYRSLSRQLGNVTNAVEKNKLGRQLKALQKDIEDTELETLKLENTLRELLFPEETPRGNSSTIGEERLVRSQASFNFFSTLHTFLARLFESPFSLIITLILILAWLLLARLNQPVSILDKREDVLNWSFQHGFYGGTLSGFFLYFAYHSKGFYKSLSFAANSAVFLTYCLLFGLLGGICWHLSEIVIVHRNDESAFGDGANWSSIICIVASLTCLYWPVKKGKKPLRRR